MDVSGVQWRRLLVEGVVIVVSILLAFAIDAWWDEQQEEQQARDQVARIVSELRANTEILQIQVDSLGFTTKTAKDILKRTKPNPEPLSKDDMSDIFVGLFSSATVSLPISATDDFLSSGRLTDGAWADVRHSLSRIVSGSRVMERASQELRAGRPQILATAGRHIAIVDVTSNHPMMGEYPASEFSYDATALLADIAFQNEVAAYAVRMEINLRGYVELLGEYEAALKQIEEAQSK